MMTPQYALGSVILLGGVLLVVGASRIARFTDPINERITGREHSDGRGYVLVGIGLVILGVAIVLGLA